MLRFVSTTFLLAASLTLQAAEKPATPFTLKDLKGKEVSFVPGRAKSVVVLNFWASWCSSCAGAKRIMPHGWRS